MDIPFYDSLNKFPSFNNIDFIKGVSQPAYYQQNPTFDNTLIKDVFPVM